MIGRFTEYHAGVPVILDKGEGRRVAAAKEVSMTANNTYAFTKVGHCPNCGGTVRGNMKHCDYCGQKLKWEGKHANSN